MASKKKELEKEIELRKRSEEIIKFWNNFFLVTSIAFFGTSFKPFSSIADILIYIMLILSGILYLITYFYYVSYHKKTTELIRKN